MIAMFANRHIPEVMFSCIFLVLPSLLSYVSAQKLPAVRPIIHVIPNCPASQNVNTTVLLKADVPAHAEVQCRHNRTFNMKEIDGVTHGLYATFSNIDDPSVCAFQKKTLTNVYILPINVLWGDGEGEVLKFWHRTVITCGFDSHSRNTSSSKQISDVKLPLLENQQNRGAGSNVKFEIVLLDVLGKPVIGMPIGRKTQLRASMTPTNGEVGFRVTSCLAIGIALQKNSTYAILRGGCGDGKVFKKKQGFQSNKLEAFSPYFEAFRLMGSNMVTFGCNFTVCYSNCDGSSCTVEPTRQKRSMGGPVPGKEKRKQYTIYSSAVEVSSEAPDIMSKVSDSRPIQSGHNPEQRAGELCGQVEITVVVFLVVTTILFTCCLSCLTTTVWGRFKRDGYHCLH